MALAVGAALGGVASSAVGGGFAIGVQSGSGTGNAFAGGAAVADDASVAWSNPAAMTLIPGRQVAGALHVVNPSFKFTNQGSSGAFASPPSPASDGGDGGDLTFIPAGFLTWALNPRMSFGIAFNAPFGLKTEYDAPWRGQLTAIKSEVKTMNINPSIAYKVSDAVSIGAGVSWQKIDAKLTNAANVAGTNIASVEADDDGFGYNLGITFQATPTTRFGAQYRSKIKYDLKGDVTLSAAPAGNSDVAADLEVPDMFSLSVFSALGQNWELMGDVSWTGWGSLKQLQIVRTSGPLTGQTLSTLNFNWDDTWRYSIGANYKLSPQTKLRFGVAFDESPTNDVDRTARLPDQDRKWLAFGVQWKPSKTSILDVGYAHEFIKDASINNPVPGQTTCVAGCLTGKFESKVDILSVQYSLSF
jgi:long-chain fatty acid transport protein